MILTQENTNTANSILEAHVREAARILLARENNYSDLDSLESVPTKHFLRWAMDCRLDDAREIADRHPDFAPVVELVGRAETLLRSGSSQRDVIAGEFNAAFQFYVDPAFTDDPGYIAFLTCLILMLLTIDPNAAKRKEVLEHAKTLLMQLEAFDTSDKDAARFLCICAEYFANYGGFRKRFLDILPEIREHSAEDVSFDVFAENKTQPPSRRHVRTQAAAPTKAVDKAISGSKAVLSKLGKRPKTVSKKNPAKPFSVTSREALFENLPNLTRTEDFCRIQTQKDLDQLRELLQSFASSVGAELSFPSSDNTSFCAILGGYADAGYKKWQHFGHFYSSDRWAAQVEGKAYGEGSEVAVIPYGQGNLRDRLKNRDAGLLLIEMSLFYCEKLRERILAE